MKIIYIFIFVFSLCLDADDFTVATYNVENLFDLKLDGTEYKEYRPYTKTWNKQSFHNKIKNITQVLHDLKADILTLQEIESQEAFNYLIQNNPQYKYHIFFKKQTASVGIALLSIYPIKSTKPIYVDKNNKYSRPILKTTLSVENHNFILYINHWRSKRASESKRIVYAMALKKEIENLDKSEDYIILGDLNSNYNEFQTFKYNKKLNDTFGITGINQILNTTLNENFIHIKQMLTQTKKVHYNLWLDYNDDKFSTLFKREYNTPDNIIISQGLFDRYGISYVQNSFQVFKPSYLIQNNKIKRWNRFKNSGYSDHLPIYATFSTHSQKFILKKTSSTQNNTIQKLYNIQTVNNYSLQNITVVYKSPNVAIIQKKDDRAIMIYKPSKKLRLGYKYNITVDKIDLFNGLKEITKISHIQKVQKVPTYANYYLDGTKINLFNDKYQNNIVKNITGIYKKGYLYFKKEKKNIKIKLYFSKKLKRPKEGENLTITSGHLSVYKSKIQIVLHQKIDFILHIQDI